MILLTLAGCLFLSDAELAAFLDEDGDGHTDVALGGDDCDDADATVTTGPDWYPDADGDGFGEGDGVASCTQPEGRADNADDCDDTDAAVSPAATETCDARDEDCDGEVDEGATDAVLLYADADGDGLGDPTTYATFCSATADWVDNADDCDDTDAARPYAQYPDADGDGWGVATDEPPFGCDPITGHVASDTDCDDADPDVNPGALEAGDGTIDVDCDGVRGDSRLENVGVFFIGDYVGAGIGAAGVPVGDLDEDGYGDVALGLPGAGTGQMRVGSGVPLVGDPGDIQAIRLEGARTWWDQGEDEAGTALATGDLDGDAVADLLVGAPGGGPSGAGKVAIFWGPLPAGERYPSAAVHGATEGDRLGEALAAGDYSGDGLADIAMSAPLARTVYLVNGPLEALDMYAASEAATTFTVDFDTTVNRPIGVLLADLDTDGVDEAVLGTPWFDTTRANAGRVYVCASGGTGELAASDCAGQLSGEAEGDNFGAAFAAGDLDDDGHLDLVVGAPGADGAVADMGAVYVYYGDTTTFAAHHAAAEASLELRGEEGADATGASAGAAVSVVGDVDGSGVADLAIGAPAWNDPFEGYGVGVGYILLDLPESGALSLSEANDRFRCMYTVGSTEGGCRAGTFVGPAGDIDGDGLDDVLVGAPGWLFDEGKPTGAMAVVFGKNVD